MIQKEGGKEGDLCKNNYMDKADELKKLSELVKEGFLTDEEFKIEKEKILNQDTAKSPKSQAKKKSSAYSFDGRGYNNKIRIKDTKQKKRSKIKDQKKYGEELVKNLEEKKLQERINKRRTCNQCGGTAVKRARSKPGMLSMGVLAPKTMEKCKDCGHRQTSFEWWQGGKSYGN